MASQSYFELVAIQLILHLGPHVHEQLAKFLGHHPHIGIDWLGKDLVSLARGSSRDRIPSKAGR